MRKGREGPFRGGKPLEVIFNKGGHRFLQKEEKIRRQQPFGAEGFGRWILRSIHERISLSEAEGGLRFFRPARRIK